MSASGLPDNGVLDESGVHPEADRVGEGSVTCVGDGARPDAVVLVEAEVGEEESRGGGVEGDVGVEGRAVALDVDLVAEEDAVPVLKGQ